MADQSLMSRVVARVVPLVSRRAFPSAWADAGDDRARLESIAKQRRALDGPRPDAILGRKWARATTEIAGRNLHLLTPKAGSTRHVLFYCHGGAFVIGPSSAEWMLAAKVATRLGCDLAVYDYPKVPETDSTAIRAATMAAYHEIASRYLPESTVIAGTSAGGGLAVSTMLQLQQDGRDLPSAALLFSPWLDMTISHPDAAQYIESDLVLPIELLRRDGELYAGPIDPMDPLVSPRFATADQLSLLPPTVVTAGELEILLPEASEFVANVGSADSDATLVTEAHGQHVGVLSPHPEGAAALAESIEQIISYRRG